MSVFDQASIYEQGGKHVLVLYTVNCSSFIANKIAEYFQAEHKPVDVIGNESCYDNQDVIKRLLRFATHPNVGAVLIVSHGCEFIQGTRILEFACERGRQVDIIFCQELGTELAIQKGIESVAKMLLTLDENRKNLLDYGIPTISLTVQSTKLNQERVQALARFVINCEQNGLAVLYQPVSLSYGLTQSIAQNANYAKELWALYEKSNFLANNGSSCVCNNTLESLNTALLPSAKGIVKIAQKPQSSGLWVLDDYQDKDLNKGYPNASISSELLEFIACGSLCNVLISDRCFELCTPITPLIVCSFDLWQKQNESNDNSNIIFLSDEKQLPSILMLEVAAVICGNKIISGNQLYAENMIFRNMQK